MSSVHPILDVTSETGIVPFSMPLSSISCRNATIAFAFWLVTLNPCLYSSIIFWGDARIPLSTSILFHFLFLRNSSLTISSPLSTERRIPVIDTDWLQTLIYFSCPLKYMPWSVASQHSAQSRFCIPSGKFV